MSKGPEDWWSMVATVARDRDRASGALVEDDALLSAINAYAVSVGDHDISIRAREVIDQMRHPRNDGVQPVAPHLHYIKTGEQT